MPVSKGNVSPSWFFFLVLQSITFCMSSLLFDWYSNALSVCLVLVVNLSRQHLMFLLLLPNHLAHKSKVNVHSFSLPPLNTLFLLTVTCFSVFCCLLLGRANDAFRRSSDRRVYIYTSLDWYISDFIHFWQPKVDFKCSLSTAIAASWCDLDSLEVKNNKD